MQTFERRSSLAMAHAHEGMLKKSFDYDLVDPLWEMGHFPGIVLVGQELFTKSKPNRLDSLLFPGVQERANGCS